MAHTEPPRHSEPLLFLVRGDGRSVTLGLGSLLLRIGGTGGAIHIEGFDPANAAQAGAIERFAFDNGTVLTQAELVARGFDLDRKSTRLNSSHG